MGSYPTMSRPIILRSPADSKTPSELDECELVPTAIRDANMSSSRKEIQEPLLQQAECLHGVGCGHLAVQHDDHIGFLNDIGQLDCHVYEAVDGEGYQTMRKKRVRHQLELKKGGSCSSPAEAHDHSHAHEANCGHLRIEHDDHYDYLVQSSNGTLLEAHHIHGNHCDVHGVVTPSSMPNSASERENRSLLSRRRELVADLAFDTAFSARAWYKDTDTMRFVVMLVLTGSFFFIELIFGVLAHSLALVADAMHMLSDLLALIMGFYAVTIAGKPSTANSTFGFTRMEVVSALMNGTFLIAICFSIFIEAIERMIGGGNADIADRIDTLLIVGSAGFLVNIAGLFLFGHGHDHRHDGHGHTHGSIFHSNQNQNTGASAGSIPSSRSTLGRCFSIIWATITFRSCRNITNLNMRGMFLHVLGDALGSVVVVVSALFVKYSKSEHRFLADPICSLIIVSIILTGTIPLVKQSVRIVLQQAPTDVDVRQLVQALMRIPDIYELHEVHVWTLASSQLIASMHVIVLEGCDFMSVSDRMKEIIHSYGIHSTTIQPEYISNLDVSCDNAL